MNKTTKIISSDFARKDVYGAINMPVYRNAAFEFDSAEAIANAFQNKEVAHTYSRISNPSVENLETKIKVASGAKDVMAFSSGMAAISNTFLTIAYSGCNIVTSPHLFGNTFSLLKITLAEFGIETRFVDLENSKEALDAIDENTVALFCELITNPHMEVADLPGLKKITASNNIPLIVDTTVVPWCAFDASKSGVDIEIVSTTKYISGGATSIGGAVIDYGTFDWRYNRKLKELTGKEMSAFFFKLKREIARNFGACMDPDTAFLQALGMESLELRFNKMAESAAIIVGILENKPEITKVSYPGLDSSPYKKISDQLFLSNPGAMLTFCLKDKEACFKFQDNLKIIRRATNLFDNKSLIIHPESTIYGNFSDNLKKMMNINDAMLRLSVGLEDVNDLIMDIEQAL